MRISKEFVNGNYFTFNISCDDEFKNNSSKLQCMNNLCYEYVNEIRDKDKFKYINVDYNLTLLNLYLCFTVNISELNENDLDKVKKEFKVVIDDFRSLIEKVEKPSIIEKFLNKLMEVIK